MARKHNARRGVAVCSLKHGSTRLLWRKWSMPRLGLLVLSKLFLIVIATGVVVAREAPWAPRSTGFDAKVLTTPVPAVPAARAALRCARCCWIESKREILSMAADGLQTFEYTVRMRDGSSGVFREELPVSWRIGTRLVFLDGVGASD